MALGRRIMLVNRAWLTAVVATVLIVRQSQCEDSQPVASLLNQASPLPLATSTLASASATAVDGSSQPDSTFSGSPQDGLSSLEHSSSSLSLAPPAKKSTPNLLYGDASSNVGASSGGVVDVDGSLGDASGNASPSGSLQHAHLAAAAQASATLSSASRSNAGDDGASSRTREASALVSTLGTGSVHTHELHVKGGKQTIRIEDYQAGDQVIRVHEEPRGAPQVAHLTVPSRQHHVRVIEHQAGRAHVERIVHQTPPAVVDVEKPPRPPARIIQVLRSEAPLPHIEFVSDPTNSREVYYIDEAGVPHAAPPEPDEFLVAGGNGTEGGTNGGRKGSSDVAGLGSAAAAAVAESATLSGETGQLPRPAVAPTSAFVAAAPPATPAATVVPLAVRAVELTPTVVTGDATSGGDGFFSNAVGRSTAVLRPAGVTSTLSAPTTAGSAVGTRFGSTVIGPSYSVSVPTSISYLGSDGGNVNRFGGGEHGRFVTFGSHADSYSASPTLASRPLPVYYRTNYDSSSLVAGGGGGIARPYSLSTYSSVRTATQPVISYTSRTPPTTYRYYGASAKRAAA